MPPATLSEPPASRGGSHPLAFLYHGVVTRQHSKSDRARHATEAMIVTGLGLGLLLQNLSLVVQNGVPTRHLGAATSAARFFRSIGGTIGVSVMGAILTARLPASGSPAPGQLASAIHPVFVLGVPLMALTLAIVLTIPELPLRRTVREAQVAQPDAVIA